MQHYAEQPRETTFKVADSNMDIAIIDDDPGFSFMLKDFLYSESQWECQIFSNGDDFLKTYASNDSRRIVLDYEFSDGPQGLTILKKIKSINPMATVIMVSGQDDLEKAVETLRQGATDYFLKTNKTVFANVACSLKKIVAMEKNKLN